MSIATIRPEEAAHFGKLAAEWWDPKGSSAMLHKLNPVRLAFLRDAIDAHWGGDRRALKPLSGKRFPGTAQGLARPVQLVAAKALRSAAVW